jgi:hypothetical protein
LYGTVALALFAAAGIAAAQTIELGEAPRRFESQDTSGWVEPIVPKSAKTRAEVAALYHSTYVPGAAVPLAWTGSIAACDPGTTDAAHQQAVIARVNYYRALNDLPPVTLLAMPETGQVQAAALIMSANNNLSHFPPATWTCYTAAGATGAGSANIALGLHGVAAIDLYMDDFGTANTATGHRRWVLFPPRTAMATGDVPGGNQPPRPANALYVLGPSGARPATPNGVAWPPAGFVPYQTLPARSNRWSFSYPGAGFTTASVTMSGPGGAIPVTFEMIQNGFGDNTLVFLPTGVSYAKPSADTTYTITVSGMTGANVPATVTYGVTIIDPDATPTAPATVDVIEYYNQVLDHYFITWIAAEIANLDAGRTPTRWTRTGSTFKAFTTPQAAAVAAKVGTSDICRYYIPPGLGDSHFFGRGTAECNATGAAHPTFVLEDPQFMFMYLPVAGVCPPGTIAVYRVFSDRADANHRYMIDRAIRDQMVARGWLAEGDGADLVVMCAPA